MSTSRYMHSYIASVLATPWWLLAIMGFGFGSIFASFFGVVGERVPRHETLGGRSHCVCGTELGMANIPIAGWLVARGKARCCGARIPPRYLLVELFLSLSWATLLASHLPLLAWSLGLVVTAALAMRLSWVKPQKGTPSPR
jgi:leader peptidase (prepilin peptidase)/N-methyltransferase